MKQNMKHTQLLAIWMCLLVMSFPFVFSSNMVTITSVSGSDNIDGVRAIQDVTKFTALVNLEEGDSNHLEQQLLVRESSSLGTSPFDSCSSAGAGSFTCVFQFPKSGTDTQSAGIHTYAVELFEGTPQAAGTTAQIFVDVAGPAVQNVQSNVVAASGGSIELTYTVSDTPSINGAACAGIDTVEIIVGESGNRAAISHITEQTCEKTETITIPTSSIPNGRNHLCVVPFDRFGQVRSSYLNTLGSNCVEIAKDTTAPRIISAAITYEGTDIPVDYLSEEPISISIEARVQTNLFDLENNQVRIDLTQLGMGTVYMPCVERFDHEYLCSSTYPAVISSGGSKQIPITATDEFGNVGTQTISATIGIDTDIPQILRFETPYIIHRADETETLSVIGATDTAFIVELQESGSGFDRNNVRVNIAGQALPMECEANICTSEPYHLGSINGIPGIASPATVSVSGTDDTGHQFSMSKSFAIDSQLPEFIHAKIINSNGLPYLVEGDDLIVQAKLQDNTGISGALTTGDFDSISGNYVPHPTCQTNSSGSFCQWIIFDIFPADRISIPFVFADAANNNVELTIDQFDLLFLEGEREQTLPASTVAIAENANGEGEDFWDPVLSEPMPPFIDEETAQVTTYRVWWELSFEQRGSRNMRIVDSSFNPAACQGEGMNLLADIEALYPNAAERGSIFLKATFRKGAIEGEEITFTCPVETTTILNNQIYPEESDEVEFHLRVANTGDLSVAVNNEIDRVKNSWLVKAEFLGTITKWLRLGKNICNMLYAINGVLTALQTFMTVIGGLDGVPFLTPIIKALSKMTEGLTQGGKGIYKLTSGFCKFVSCNSKWQNYYKKFVDSHKINNLGGRKLGANPNAPQNIPATIWPSDPSESLILSLVSLCIPGILFNLQKARQIECQYLACLHEETAHGTPVFVCSKLRNYGWCRYVVGEVFQIVPFASFFQSLAGTIRQLFSNPISTFLGISNWACAHLIPVSSISHGFCHLVPQLVQMGNVLNDINTIKSMDWELKDDQCTEILEKIEEGSTEPSADEGVGGTG